MKADAGGALVGVVMGRFADPLRADLWSTVAVGPYTLVTPPIGNVLTYTNSGLTNGTTYYFQVTAVNAIGEGVASNTLSAIPVPTLTTTTRCSGGNCQN